MSSTPRKSRMTKPFRRRLPHGLRDLLAVSVIMLCVSGTSHSHAAQAPTTSSEGTAKPAASPASQTLRLSLDDAIAFFLRQNLDLLISKYGIDYARGQQMTARLFPNPVATVGTLASFTQGHTAANSGQLTTQIQQLFELAGKRGYRIESAGYGAQSAEAAFEDAVRQLSYTV